MKIQRDRFIMFPSAEKSGLRFCRHINPVTVFSPLGTRDKLQALKSSYVSHRLQMVSAVMCSIFCLTKECPFAKYSSLERMPLKVLQKQITCPTRKI